MSQQLNLIKVFIASPNDLVVERKRFRHVVATFNSVRARSDNYFFEPVGWEDTLSGVGRPQQLINEDLKGCDILVMLLGSRWGTPTGKFSAGTEEEFNLAYELYQRAGRPDILLYFRSVPQAQLADPGPQLQQVIEFKKRLDAEQKLLYKVYERPKLLEQQLMQDFARWLDRKLHGPGYGAAADGKRAEFTGEVSNMNVQLKQLQQQDKAMGDAPKTKESELRTVAIDLAVEAARLLAQGRVTQAEQKFVQSVKVYKEPEVLINYGLLLYQIGSLERAAQQFEQVCSLPSTPENDPHRARASKKLGNVYLTWGKLDDAERMFEQALDIARSLKRRELMANYHGALGDLFIERNEIDRAEKAYMRALRMSQPAGDENAMRKAHGSLGNVYVERGQLGRAKTAFGKALDLAEKLKHKQGMASAYLGLGIVSERQKKYAEAEEAYSRALKLARSLGHKAGMERAYGNLGNLYKSRGELAKARRMYEAALELAKAVGHKDGMALTYVNLADIEEARGETGEGRELLTRALELYQQIGNKEEVGKLSARLNPKPAKKKSERRATRTLRASSSAKGGPRRPARKGAVKKSGVRPYRPFVGSKKR